MNACIFIQFLDYAGQLPTYNAHTIQSLPHLIKLYAEQYNATNMATSENSPS